MRSLQSNTWLSTVSFFDSTSYTSVAVRRGDIAASDASVTSRFPLTGWNPNGKHGDGFLEGVGRFPPACLSLCGVFEFDVRSGRDHPTLTSRLPLKCRRVFNNIFQAANEGVLIWRFPKMPPSLRFNQNPSSPNRSWTSGWWRVM